MSPDKLVYMANQIGRFFAHEGSEKGAVSTATHIRKFWDPRMRQTIFSHLDAGGDGLDPIPLRALQQLHGVEPAESH
jgi:formate dehydrogenase subunit delta